MVVRFLMILVCLLPSPWLASATVRNVGSGQQYATIQAGVDAAVAGDEVRIHSGTYNECVETSSNGTQQNPIVITAAAGHNPVWTATCEAGNVRGALHIQNNSYWTINGTLNGGTLTFDGSPGNNPLWAIMAWAHNQDIHGIQIRNVTCRDWATNQTYDDGAGMGCFFFRNNCPGSSNFETRDSLAIGNTITNTGMGIRATGTPNFKAELNTIHDMICVNHGHGERSAWAIKYGRGACPNNESGDQQFRYNNIYNLEVCSADGGINTSCIYCDVGKPGNNIIEYNYCHDNNEGDNSPRFKGLFVEANCGDTTVRYNLVANVAGIGLQSRDPAGSPGHTPETRWYRNTVYDAGDKSLYMRDGNDGSNNCSGGICVIWRGNLFMQTRAAAEYVWVFRPTASSQPLGATLTEWDAEENWYYNSANNPTPFKFEYNASGTPNQDFTFAQWQANCGGCDDTTTHGTNPQFVAETGTVAGDFMNLDTGSPAIDGCGTNSAMGPFLGSAHDCGAFEAHLFGSAATTNSATTLVVTFQSIHGALTACTANRFEVDASITGNNLVPTAVSVSGNQATLTVPTLRNTDVITISAERNACRTVFIPGTPMAVGSAAFTNRTVTNNIGGGTTTAAAASSTTTTTTAAAAATTTGGEIGAWVSGTTHTKPTGSDRLLLIGFCWSQQATSPPLSITSPTYGGQSCTIIDSQLSEEGNAQTLAALARCSETAIAAASTNTIGYTTSETPSSTRPVIVASHFYTDINQSTPVTDSDKAQVENSTTLSTPALTTTNPGVAATIA